MSRSTLTVKPHLRTADWHLCCLDHSLASYLALHATKQTCQDWLALDLTQIWFQIAKLVRYWPNSASQDGLDESARIYKPKQKYLKSWGICVIYIIIYMLLIFYITFCNIFLINYGIRNMLSIVKVTICVINIYAERRYCWAHETQPFEGYHESKLCRKNISKQFTWIMDFENLPTKTFLPEYISLKS